MSNDWVGESGGGVIRSAAYRPTHSAKMHETVYPEGQEKEQLGQSKKRRGEDLVPLSPPSYAR